MPAKRKTPTAKRTTGADAFDANAGRVLAIVMGGRINQTELANKIGVHQTTVSRLLAGDQRWTLRTMHQFATALDVDPAIFLENSDEVLRRLDDALRFARDSELPAQWRYAA